MGKTVDFIESQGVSSYRFKLENISTETIISCNAIDLTLPKNIHYRFYTPIISTNGKISDVSLRYEITEYKRDLHILKMITDPNVKFFYQKYPDIPQEITKDQLISKIEEQLIELEALAI